MTEAGKRWVKERIQGEDNEDNDVPPSLEMTFHEVRQQQAEFWIRAFCEEVERRAEKIALANSHGIPHDPNFVDYSEAFANLKRELLGE